MKIMFNEDFNHFFISRYKMGVDVSEEYLKEFIFQYKDTQVTDFAFNVNARLSGFPSSVLQSFPDKYLQKEENGEPVDYSDTLTKVAYNIFVEKKIDMYKVWADALREINIRPWASIRINDCHASFSETHWLLSDHFHQNKDKRRVTHREACGYFDRCYDFSHPEIQKMMKDYIWEVLERYDVYGLELDLDRELMCFKPGFETTGMEIMNNFMRDVKSLLEKAEKLHGHEMKLTVLVDRDPNMNYNAGFDVVQWAQEGIIDIVVGMPRWSTVDTNVPIQLWKKLLSPYNVKFAAGHQILISPYAGAKAAISSLDTVIGNAAAFLSNGADFTYLYNYMDNNADLLPGNDFKQNALRTENLEIILSTVGDKHLANNSSRKHVLTYNDHPNYWEKMNCRLPIQCREKYFESVRLAVGEIPENADVYLVMGVASGETLAQDDFEVYVNCQPVSLDSLCDIETNVCDDQGYKFKIENYSDILNYAVVELRTTGKEFTVNYVEISIIVQ